MFAMGRALVLSWQYLFVCVYMHADVRCMLVRRGVCSCALHAHAPCLSVCVWCGSSPRVRVVSVCPSCYRWCRRRWCRRDDGGVIVVFRFGVSVDRVGVSSRVDVGRPVVRW